uniref:FAM13A-like domain-containing protein n=1 Tax=Rhizochromulina marina TaxID=1034831 RepID=A0A7S2RA23_9STRA|mmetsp:Transcript_13247/g.38536  ORF Transcript_13247/g.38536 Transcript_13247/m.38536 type:complete len:588 (+) Transcript_13247:78-1841(+)
MIAQRIALHLRRRAVHEPHLFRTPPRPVDKRASALLDAVYRVAPGLATSESSRTQPSEQRQEEEEAVDRLLALEKNIKVVAAALVVELRKNSHILVPSVADQLLGLSHDGIGEHEERRLAGIRSVLQLLPNERWGQLRAIVLLCAAAARGGESSLALADLFTPLLAAPTRPDPVKFGRILQLAIEYPQEIFAETAMRSGPSGPSEVAFITQLIRASVSSTLVGIDGQPHVSAVQCVDARRSVSEGFESAFAEQVMAADRHVMGSPQQRRQLLHACRCLRAQVKRFEEDHCQRTGHPPRGRERGPLLSTYAQYREWKKNIRDYAACRLQALVRGLLYRARMQRSSEPRRSGSPEPEVQEARSLPLETSAPETGADAPRSNNHEDDPLQAPRLSLPEPSWTVGPPQNPDLEIAAPSSTCALERPQSPHHGMTHLDMDTLQSEKRRVKAALKAFDSNFMTQHGRLPSKSEKEAIRDQYELYHALKAELRARDSSVEELPAPPLSQSARTVTPPRTHSSDTRIVETERQKVRAEKRMLHDSLKKFEREFERTHGRPVQTMQDIAVVQKDYDRYKELKLLLEGTNLPQDAAD